MTTDAITIRTNSETIQRLDRLAKDLDRSRNDLVNEALQAYLEEQVWQVEAIKQGLADLDRGRSIPHEQVMDEMRDMITTRSKQTDI